MVSKIDVKDLKIGRYELSEVSIYCHGVKKRALKERNHRFLFGIVSRDTKLEDLARDCTLMVSNEMRQVTGNKFEVRKQKVIVDRLEDCCINEFSSNDMFGAERMTVSYSL